MDTEFCALVSHGRTDMAVKTYMLKKEDVKRSCYLVDAKDQILGRLATKIANLLSGKNQPYYTPHIDAGNTVVVINAEKIRVTGKKHHQKFYKRYSGYPGGLKLESLKTLLERKPTEVLRLAVKGMLPKNKHQGRMIRRLKIYAGDEHPHKSQNPIPI